jgi:predicted transcriptional regulator of viral defense system
MTPLTQLIIKSGDANRILSARQLERLLGGSDARRYGQVNRALKAGELLQARRGLYLLSKEYRTTAAHPFALAQHIIPGSYVSAESALGFHGWIPEAVHSVLSVTARGKSVSYEHESLGKFEYRRMTVKPGYFLQAVTRHELLQQTALIAEPMRALVDLVYLRKLPWQSLDYLFEGLRIDEQAIRAVSPDQISQLLNVYKGKREQLYINKLLTVL